MFEFNHPSELSRRINLPSIRAGTSKQSIWLQSWLAILQILYNSLSSCNNAYIILHFSSIVFAKWEILIKFFWNVYIIDNNILCTLQILINFRFMNSSYSYFFYYWFCILLVFFENTFFFIPLVCSSLPYIVLSFIIHY